MDKNIKQQNIAESCKEWLNIFAANKNLMRVTPSMIDGLKPGLRRTLYIMYLKGNMNEFRKISYYTGYTMAELHPHADTSLYDSLVSSAQSWNNNIPLVEPQGNFGSIKGDSAAAARYIEAKLSMYAYKCFFEDFKETPVDMKESFDGRVMEPEYLPAKYPNALINGSLGIGTGLASNIPPYNFSEVIEQTIKLIKNPNHKVLLVPDSPTGCQIIDDGEFGNISTTGNGKYRMRGVFRVNELNNSIDIISLPYSITLNTVIANILALIDSKSIDGITDILDETNKSNGIKCFIKIKNNVNPQKMIETLYKKNTGMQKTYPVDMIFIDNYKDINYNLTSFLQAWIDYRRDSLQSLYNNRLIKAEEDFHLNKIIIFIFNETNSKRTINLIQSSRNRSEVVEKLMNEYKMTSIQAGHIYESKLSMFTGELVERARKKNDDIAEFISKCNDIIGSGLNGIDKIIIEQLQEGNKLFGRPRKSKIVDLRKGREFEDTPHYLLVSQDGYVKKYGEAIDDFGTLGKERAACMLIKCSNREKLLIFDSSGSVFKIKISTIPDGNVDTIGTSLSRYLDIKGNIVSVIKELDIDIDDNSYCGLFVTTNGYMKKTLMSDFIKIKDKKMGISLDDNDELVSVEFVSETSSKDLLIYTNLGHGVRIDANDAPIYGNKAKGLRSMKLKDGEYVVGTNKIVTNNKLLLYVTKNGKIKVTEMKYFPQMKRKSDSLSLINLDNDEELFCIKAVNNDNIIKIVTRKGESKEFNVSDLTTTTRVAKAEKLLKNMRGDEVIGVVVK